ncbi:hypothetical protein ACN28S_45230 [Cystobacter fuscus]
MLASALVLAGCKSNPPAPATVDAGVAAASTPGKELAPVPAAGPSLSYLKRADPERCEWVRLPFPSGNASAVFSFDADCSRSEVSWSPDGKEGLVFTGRWGRRPRLACGGWTSPRRPASRWT